MLVLGFGGHWGWAGETRFLAIATKVAVATGASAAGAAAAGGVAGPAAAGGAAGAAAPPPLSRGPASATRTPRMVSLFVVCCLCFCYLWMGLGWFVFGGLGRVSFSLAPMAGAFRFGVAPGAFDVSRPASG